MLGVAYVGACRWLQKDDQSRFFVILFFLEDDTIAIREVRLSDMATSITALRPPSDACGVLAVAYGSLLSATAALRAAISWPAPSSPAAPVTSSLERECLRSHVRLPH